MALVSFDPKRSILHLVSSNKKRTAPLWMFIFKMFFFLVHFCLSLFFFFLICTDKADTCSVSLHIVSCIQGADLGVSRDYNSDLSGEEFCLCNLLPPSCLQYSLSTGRWCALFRIPRFPHTEACLLTRDMWKCSGVGLPNLSSHPPHTTTLIAPLPSLPSPPPASLSIQGAESPRWQF